MKHLQIAFNQSAKLHSKNNYDFAHFSFLLNQRLAKRLFSIWIVCSILILSSIMSMYAMQQNAATLHLDGIEGNVADEAARLNNLDSPTAKDEALTSKINVIGEGQNIPNASWQEGASNRTFLNTPIGQSSTKTYTLQNTGSSNLTIERLDFTDFGRADYSYKGLTFPLNIAPGESKDFTVTFTPSSIGQRRANLNFVNNNDPSVGTFYFVLYGEGTPVPEIRITGNSVNIPLNDTNTIVADNTDFGGVGVGDSKTNSFTIHNDGTADLVIQNTLLGGPSNTGFSLNQYFTGTVIHPGQSVNFSITYTPQAYERNTGIVAFVNNDSDESYFQFVFTGVGVDITPPSVVTQNLTVQLDANGNASITPEQIDNGSTDDSGGQLAFALDRDSFDCQDISATSGDHTVSLTVTDSNGNSARGTAEITVEDNMAPSISQGDALELDFGASFIPASVTATDNCGQVNAGVISNNVNTSVLGTYQVIYQATDASGNASNQMTQTVTVVDNVTPTVITQNVTVSLGPDGTATLSASAFDAGSTDNSPGALTFTINGSSEVSFDCDDIDSETNQISALNFGGGTIGLDNVSAIPVGTSTYTIEAWVYPESYGNAPGGGIVGWGSYGTRNLVNALRLDSNIGFGVRNYWWNNDIAQASSETFINRWTHVAVTYNGTERVLYFDGVEVERFANSEINISDANNFAIGKTFGAEYFDGFIHELRIWNDARTEGEIQTNKDSRLNGNEQGLALYMPMNEGSGTPQDQSSTGASGIINGNVTWATMNAPFSGNTVTLTVTDANGNSATGTAEVIVEDNVAPVVAQTDAIQLETGDTFTPAEVVATDNCGTITAQVISNTVNTAVAGSYQVQYQATDASGNQSNVMTQTVNVVVADPTPPTVIANPNLSVNLDQNGQGTISVDDVDNGSFDNGSGIASRSIDRDSFTCSDLQSPIVVTLTVTDAVGNSSTGTTTVTVIDAITPAITQLAEMVLEVGDTFTPAAVTATDNCASITAQVISNTVNTSALGTYQVQYQATDASGNESNLMTQTVRIVDNTAPVVATQNITVQLDANGNANITPEQVDDGSADNSGQVNLSLNQTAFDCSDIRLNPGTALTFDGTHQFLNANNVVRSDVGNLSYEMWVKPTAAHEIDPQTDRHIYGTSGQKYAIWPQLIQDFSNTNRPFGTGISIGTNGVSVYGHTGSYMPALLVWQGQITDWTHVAVVFTNDQPSLYINGAHVATGVKPYFNGTNRFIPQLNLGDGSGGIGAGAYGNFEGQIDEVRFWTKSLSQNEIQTNLNKPLSGDEVGLEAYFRLNEGSGTQVINSSNYNKASNPNYNNATFVNLDPNSDWVNSSAGIAELQVTLTVTDPSGNSSTGTAFITVEDNIAPVIDQTNAVELILGETFKPAKLTASDNCGQIDAIIISNNVNSSVVGTYQVQFLATDASGNQSNVMTQMVEVRDVNPPVITSPTTVSIPENRPGFTYNIQATDETTLIYSFGSGNDEDYFDLFGSKFVFKSPPDFEIKSSYTVNIIATDASGNSDNLDVVINIIDIDEIPPVFSTLDNSTIAERTTDWTYIAAATDNANAVTLWMSQQKDAGLFTFDPVTGILTFNNPPDYSSPMDANRDNVYEVDIFASDGLNSSVLPLKVSVTNLQPEISLRSTTSTIINSTGLYIYLDLSERLERDLVASDFNVTNGQIINIQKLNIQSQLYRFVLLSSEDGIASVMVNQGKIRDLAGAKNLESNQLTYTFEARNEIPSDLGLSYLDEGVVEFDANAVLVGTLTTEDEDIGDTHTYRLIPGAGAEDGAKYYIQGDKLYKKSGAVFDRSVQETSRIRIQTIDRKGSWRAKYFDIPIASKTSGPSYFHITIEEANSYPEQIYNQRIGEYLGWRLDYFKASGYGIGSRERSIDGSGYLILNQLEPGVAVTRKIRIKNMMPWEGQIDKIVLPDNFTLNTELTAIPANGEVVLDLTYNITSLEKFIRGKFEIYSGNHIFSLLTNALPKRPNTAPYSDRPAVSGLNLGRVDGFRVFELWGRDNEEDRFNFQFQEQPKTGTMTVQTPIDKLGSNWKKGNTTFTPNGYAGVRIRDSFKFKLVEPTTEGLSSEVHTIVLSYERRDIGHKIDYLRVEGGKFRLAISDEAINPEYIIRLFRRTSAGQELIYNDTIAHEDFDPLIGSQFLHIIDPDEDIDNLYDTNGNLIIIADVIGGSYRIPRGFTFKKSVDANAIVEGAELDNGEFVVIGSNSSVEEGDDAELNITAFELGDLDLTGASVEVATPALYGTVSAPEVVRNEGGTIEWKVQYSFNTEVGLIDSVEFKVNHPNREGEFKAYAVIEIVDIPDEPTLGEIEDVQSNEDIVVLVDFEANDVDSELSLQVSTSDDNVTAEIVDNQIRLTPAAEFTGNVLVELSATELNVDDPFTVTEAFNLEILEVNDSPVINVIADQTMDEDDYMEVPLSATDVEQTGFGVIYTISSDADDQVYYSFNGNSILIEPNENFNGEVNFNIIADDLTGTATAQSLPETFKLTVNAVNDAPELINFIPVQTLVEGFENYTLDLNNFFNDIDSDQQALIYTITGITNVNTSFENGNMIISSAEGNYGLQVGEVSVSDGEFSVSQEVTFNVSQPSADITVENQIEDLNLSEDFEEQRIDLSDVFTHSVDPDAVFSYSLAGNQNLNVFILDSELVVMPNENYNGSETILVTAFVNDDANSTSFTINVAPLNDSPELVSSLDNLFVLEDADLNTELATDRFTDIDGDDLTITADFSAAWLSFDATSNSLVGTPENRDVGQVNVTVTATDPSGAAVSDDFIITVQNTNDAPTDINISSSSFDENIAQGTAIASLSTIDEDLSNDSFIYSLVSGEGDADNAAFSINDDQLLTAVAFDFETNSSYSIRVRTDDGFEGTFEKSFTITVNDLNEGPTDITFDNLSLDENLEAGTVVGTPTTTDQDANENHIYELVAGDGDADNSSFDFVNGALLTTESFNFEKQNAFSIRVKSTDKGGLSVEQSFVVSVTDVAEALPVFESNPMISISEQANYRYPIQVTSPTGLEVTVSLSEDIDWLRLEEEDGYTAVLVGQSNCNLGQTEVQLVATEKYGGVAIQTFTVLVEDATAPIIEGRDLSFILLPTEEVSITVDDVLVSVTDPCGVAVTSISKDRFTTSDVGINEVVITATDVNGNEGTVTVNVEIFDVSNDSDNDGIPDFMDKYPKDPTNGGKPAILSYVWDDLDGDGRQDTNEPGISDVLVKLRKGNGSVIKQGRTNEFNSMIAFFDLNESEQVKLSFDKPNASFAFTHRNRGNGALNSDADRNNGQTSTFRLTGSDVSKNYDAGMWSPGRVETFVWDDLDGDGRQDANEPGISNVLVKLRKSNGSVISQARTDVNGIVKLDKAPADQSIKLSFDKPSASYAFTYSNRGNGSQNSDADRNKGETSTFKLSRGNQTYTTIDAGMWSPGQIESFVWDDLDGDGKQDWNEPGLPNVLVKLRKSNGSVISQARTDVNGMVTLDKAPADQSIKLSFDKPSASYAFTYSNRGNGSQNSDADRNKGETSTFKLNRGNQTYTTADAGMWSPGQIESFVWDDLDGDGKQDANEPGLPNVLVKLRKSNGSVISQARTDVNGVVTLDKAPADQSIKLSFDKPSTSYAFTHRNRGNGALNSDVDRNKGETSTFKLSRGNQTYNTADAGMWSPGEVQVYVWNDEDKNGRQDSRENGLNNVLVKLRRSNGQLISQVRADSYGLVRMVNVPADENVYITVEKAGKEWEFSPKYRGNQNFNSDVDKNGRSQHFRLFQGAQLVSNIDAGQYNSLIGKGKRTIESTELEESLIQEDQLDALTLRTMPNPATTLTSISFMSSKSGNVKVGIVNQKGALIKQLYNDVVEAGKENVVTLDVTGLATGVYIIRLVSADGARSVKLIVTR